MALSLIDVGTTANDGTGDPLRTAFQTVNTALTAVNNAVVVGTGVTTFKDDSGSAGVSVLSNGFVGIGTPSPSVALEVAGTVGATAVVGSSYLSADTDVRLGNASFSRIGVWDSGTGSFGGGYNSTVTAGVLVHDSTGSLAGYMYNSIGSLAFFSNTSQTAGTAALLRATLTSGGDFQWQNAGATVGMTWDASANSNAGGLGVGTSAPTEQLDLSGDAIRIRTAQTPASAAATGDAGMICWDASYIYVCTATNTWKRAAIATW
jgi:hypothetical protein